MPVLNTNEWFEEDKVSGFIPFGIRRVDISELPELVAIGLKEDADLINKYHFQDQTMEELILNNIKNIEELAKTKEVKCYGIYLEDINPIGFTVTSEKLLYSFGINIYCREAAIKAEWFKWLRKHFDNNFVVCLYKENARAINYFLNNGLDEFSDEGKVIYLLYNSK